MAWIRNPELAPGQQAPYGVPIYVQDTPPQVNAAAPLTEPAPSSQRRSITYPQGAPTPPSSPSPAVKTPPYWGSAVARDNPGIDWTDMSPAGQAKRSAQLGGQSPVAQRGGSVPNSLQALYAAQQAQQNPYGQQYIQGAQQQAQLAFAPQQQALSGALAGRGMMGSGQEVAQRAALGGAQARSLLDIAQNAQQQGINWQQNQNNRLFDMAQGIEQNKFARDQFDWQKKQAAYNRQRQEEQDQYSWITPVATIAGAALAGPFGAAAGNALGNAFQPDRRYYS